jgi:hypothetical protein
MAVFHDIYKIEIIVSMKMAVFRVVAPCSLAEVYQRFRGTTRRNNPEDSQLLTHRRENLKSYLLYVTKLSINSNTGLLKKKYIL